MHSYATFLALLASNKSTNNHIATYNIFRDSNSALKMNKTRNLKHRLRVILNNL